MKKIIFILLFTLSFSMVKADLGIPTIQAICKVTLKDGTTKEGIISFGKGGYYYHYRPHGFCFVHVMGIVSLNLYDFRFRKFSPDDYQPYSIGEARLYYIRNRNVQHAPETEYGVNDSTRLLKRSTVDEDQFDMLDEMIMYTSIPLSMYIEDEGAETIQIPVDQIQSVEILAKPGKAWLNLIKEARERFSKEAADWGDYIEPVWYHDVIQDPEMVKELSKYF
jgi:hypothetical protein